MNKKELEVFDRDTAKLSDLYDFHQMLTKVTVETTLNAGLVDHLGHERHQQSESSDSRDVYPKSTLKTKVGQFQLDPLTYRVRSFELQPIKKQQTHIPSLNDKILSLYQGHDVT